MTYPHLVTRITNGIWIAQDGIEYASLWAYRQQEEYPMVSLLENRSDGIMLGMFMDSVLVPNELMGGDVKAFPVRKLDRIEIPAYENGSITQYFDKKVESKESN